ncbi:unnamed protein product, partial [Rotaria socialis]
MLIEEHPSIKISLASFQDLRPPNICYKSSTPHNVCVCYYHENVALLLKSLNEHIHGLKSIDINSFIKLIVCDDARESCMFRECNDCSHHFKRKIEDQIINSTLLIKWTLWSTSLDGRATKVDYEGSVLDCIKILCDKIKPFLFHAF